MDGRSAKGPIHIGGEVLKGPFLLVEKAKGPLPIGGEVLLKGPFLLVEKC